MEHKGKKKDWKKFNKSSVNIFKKFHFCKFDENCKRTHQEAKAEVRGKFITLND